MIGEDVVISGEQSSFVQFCQNMAEPSKSGRLNQSIADMENEYFSKLRLSESDNVVKPDLTNQNKQIIKKILIDRSI